MENLTQKIRDAAKGLFAENKVDVIIGFETGSLPLKSAPCFIRTGDDVERLIWNSSCGNNLAAYLPRKKGRIGIVVKGCDSRSIVGLLKENQIKRENLVIIGVPCKGMISPKAVAKKLQGRELLSAEETDDDIILKGNGFEERAPKKELLSESCALCRHRNPLISDILIGEAVEEQTGVDEFARITEFEGKSPEERWEYFSKEAEKCIRCYACRNACPICFCEECCVDASQPQWFGKSIDPTDTRIFHLMRCYHTTGRCVDCGACVRACPMDVDLRFLNKKIEKDVRELFSYEAGVNPDEPPPLNTYTQNDPEEFIK